MSDPACPGCGMTAQVDPSRKHPGKFMCHGCARYFDAPDDSGGSSGLCQCPGLDTGVHADWCPAT